MATLWKIDDEASARLFVRFHTEYRKTGDPVAAIHQAQVEMLKRWEDPPRVWAATQVFVGAGHSSKGGVL